MNANPHGIFRTKDDYHNWDKYIEQCGMIDGLSSLQKEQARRAFQYLQKTLGPTFLKQVHDSGHPLLQLLMNAAAWSRIKLVGLAEALEALEEAENFKKILKRIRAKPDKSTKLENRWQSITEKFTETR